MCKIVNWVGYQIQVASNFNRRLILLCRTIVWLCVGQKAAFGHILDVTRAILWAHHTIGHWTVLVATQTMRYIHAFGLWVIFIRIHITGEYFLDHGEDQYAAEHPEAASHRWMTTWKSRLYSINKTIRFIQLIIGLPFSLLIAMSLLHASGNRWRNTSPNNPPTAKLSSIFSDFDSAAAICDEQIHFNELIK